MQYIDMHCDTLGVALTRQLDSITRIEASTYSLRPQKIDASMVDIVRLIKGGAMAQFFAMFVPQREVPYWFEDGKMPEHEALLQKMQAIFIRTLKENRDHMAFAQSYERLEENRKNGKLSAFLTMENAYAVRGKMENLKKFHDMGVGLMTLTWNDPNCFGWNHSKDPAQMQKGLTDFGKEAIAVMNDLGIIIDVSHLSDGGFYDVAKLTKKPFVASHSNCRALAPATRNLTDEMIRMLAECGGVAGINFEPTFLNTKENDRLSRVSRICDHIEHFIKVGGIECIGIGTDFDGITGEFEIFDCTRMDLLFDELHRRGFSEDAIEKIAYKNVARVIKESMKEGAFSLEI